MKIIVFSSAIIYMYIMQQVRKDNGIIIGLENEVEEIIPWDGLRKEWRKHIFKVIGAKKWKSSYQKDCFQAMCLWEPNDKLKWRHNIQLTNCI